MTATRTYLAALLVVAGCGLDDGPEAPTWATDVKPILDANCVRCHGFPATGGAPDSFRLDVLEDFVAADGRIIRGAATMSDYIATRVDPSQTEPRGVESMPPRDATGQGLSDRQIGILSRWFLRGESARGAPPSGNRAPTMEITWSLQDSIVDGQLVIQYEIRDPDHDLVTGELRAGPSFESGVRVGALHGGRGQVVWDVGAEPAGTYGLFARLDDGDLHEVALGDYQVEHSDGNHAPSVLVTRPGPYDIISKNDADFSIGLAIGDLDAGDLLTVTVDAVRGDDRRNILADEPVVAGANELAWTPATRLDEGGGWRLEVTVSDGTVTRSVTTLPFRVSLSDTSLTFARVAPLLGQRCGVCHGSGRIPSITHDFAIYEDTDVRGVYSMRGLIYRRAIEQRNMPPPTHVVQSERVEDAVLTDTERDMLENWLLGGAPQ